jgi:hypothetical protein
VLKQVSATSPFVIVGPVPDAMFFGREHELSTIARYLRDKTSCAVISGRRVGKTSILFRLHRVHLPSAGFYSVYLDCSPIRSFDDFAHTSIREWRPEYRNSPQTFGDLLHAAPHEHQIVLLLDEADKLVQVDRADDWRLFKHLRALANSGGIQVVLSGERVLRDALRDASSPMFNFTQQLIVNPFDLAEVEELVSEPLKQLEFELVDQASIVQRIYEFTAGHPNVIQRLGHRLVEHPTVRSSRRIKPDDIETIINDPSFQRDDFLGTFWEAATVLEKIVSLLMVANTKARTLRSVRQILTRRCKISPSARDVDEALQGLVDLRSILKRTPAGYDFAMDAFPRVVQSTVTLEDMLEVLSEEYTEQLS